MTTNMVFLCLIFRGSFHAAEGHTSISVSQAPQKATVPRGGNITLYCIIPILQDQTWVRVLWWKHGENEYLHKSAGKRTFGMASKVSGFFQLLDATFQDSGLYHCSVIQRGVVRGNGTGSHLIVHAAPTPLRIVPRTSEWDSSTSLALVCETAAFYPENFTLTWFKNGVENSFGIHTSKMQNSEGLYEVSSYLVETQPFRSDANYTCLVSHVSLKDPAVVTYVSKSNQDNVQNSLYYWIPVCEVVRFAILLLMSVIGRRYRVQENEGKEEHLTGGNRREELGADSDFVRYAALDLKKTPMGKREKTKQKIAGADLMYASVALPGSGKGKAIERSTEYAELRTTKQNGVREAVYTEAKIN